MKISVEEGVQGSIDPENNHSFIFCKKKTINAFKWLGYFPIRTNSTLSEFRVDFVSFPFIFRLLQALIILSSFAALRVIVIHPTKESKSNQSFQNADNSGNFTDWTLISYKSFNFTAVVDYLLVVEVTSYFVIITLLCKRFSVYLTKLIRSIEELEAYTKEPTSRHSSMRRHWMVYIGFILHMFPGTFLIFGAVVTIIVYHKAWKIVFIYFMDGTMTFVALTWHNITRTLFEIIFTISANKVINHFKVPISKTKTTNVSYLGELIRKKLELLDNFRTCFGPLLTLHIWCYTIELLVASFGVIINLSEKILFTALFICLPPILGSFFKTFNIVGQCSILTEQINIYVEYLDDYYIHISRESTDRAVS